MESRVKRLLADLFSISGLKINNCSRLVEDLNADSVDIVELVMVAEVEFKVVLSSKDVEGWKTVGDVVDSIAEADILKSGSE